MNKVLLNRGQGLIGKIASRGFTKASAAYLDDFSVGPTLYPAVVRLTDKDCWQLYKGNDWILATVDRIVADCVKVIPKVLPKEDGIEIKGNLKDRIAEVQNFLDHPNPNKEAFFEIREKTIRDLLVLGRGIIEKVLDRKRKLREIYATSPEYIRIQADQHGNLPFKETYVLRHWRNNVPAYFDADEMIFMVHRPISKSSYGLRILDGIANTVAADILRANYNANFFLNGAEAAGVLGLEGMNNRELKKFQAWWRENFRGAKNAHKMAAVNVPVKYVRMAITNRDLEFDQYGHELRARIFAAFGMLPFVLGIIDENTGKLNSDQQIQIYKDGALKPILMKESFYYTNELVRVGFGYDDIKIGFPSIDLLDQASQAEVDREDVNSGIRTINEIRTQRGHGHVEWGDTPISVMPGGGQVDPKTGKLMPPSQNKDSGGKSKKKKPAKSKKGKKGKKKFLNSAKLKINAILRNLDPMDPNYKSKLEKFLEISLKTKKFKKTAMKVRKTVFKNISRGTIPNIYPEIDKFVEERS